MSGCVLLSPTILSPPKTKLHSSSCSHSCNSPGRWHRGRKAHPKQACTPGERESEVSHLNGHTYSRTEKSNVLLLSLLQYPVFTPSCTIIHSGILCFCSNLPREPLDLHRSIFKEQTFWTLIIRAE